MHPPRRRFPLVLRLACAVLVAGAALGVLLLGWLEPRTTSAFQRLGADFLDDGRSAMLELAHEHSTLTSDLIIDVLRAAAIDREQALAQLQLQRFDGDADATRRAIADDDARRSAHQQQNVIALTTAGQRRVESSIETRLRALAANQGARTDEFVGELRTMHAWLVATTMALLLAVLGFAIHRTVVQPAAKLAAATRRIAGGDLQTLPTVAPTLPGNDEIGDLARDFAAMIEQLRAARAAQERLHASLADQVADKTAHLEQALQDLRASHLQLAQAERLAALGTLAGGIAHEFHNVIGGIRGCATDLAADEPQPDRRDTLAVIVRAADRATGIVQQLLRFARRSVDSTATFDPAAVVDDALRLCEPAARRQQVVVERELGTGLRIDGDANAVHQVLVNLFVNALQAMPGGGTLRVQVANDGDRVRFTVTDTGTGIAAADLPHVFEPFFTTRGGEADPARRGSGLGLSVSWGIVTAHRGRIEVHSTRGAGTTFTIWLPVRAAAADSVAGTERTS
jgi:signal transduction histidine kinase